MIYYDSVMPITILLFLVVCRSFKETLSTLEIKDFYGTSFAIKAKLWPPSCQKATDNLYRFLSTLKLRFKASAIYLGVRRTLRN